MVHTHLMWADFVIIAILAISVVISLFRGFSKEALSLISWCLAIYFGISFADKGAQFFASYIATPSMRQILSFTIIVIASLIILGLINLIIIRLLHLTGLSALDRFLGMFFGLARGIVVVMVLVMISGFTPFPKDPWWQASKLIPSFQSLAVWTSQYLPDSFANLLDFEQQNIPDDSAAASETER